MDVEKYQNSDFENQSQQPKQVREELKNLLNMVEHSNIKNPCAVQTYNLLCSVEALLQRYETASRETLFAIGLMNNREECCNYLVQLHSCIMKESIYFCPINKKKNS